MFRVSLLKYMCRCVLLVVYVAQLLTRTFVSYVTCNLPVNFNPPASVLNFRFFY